MYAGIASDGKTRLYLGHGSGTIYSFTGSLENPAYVSFLVSLLANLRKLRRISCVLSSLISVS